MFIICMGGDYRAAGSEVRKLLAENVLQIHGLVWGGLTGYSVMELAGRALGSANAKERFGARFFRKSATPGVNIKKPRKLSDQAMRHLKESWQSMRIGIEQSCNSNGERPGKRNGSRNGRRADSQIVGRHGNVLLVIGGQLKLKRKAHLLFRPGGLTDPLPGTKAPACGLQTAKA